jgi:hypothetical protein
LIRSAPQFQQGPAGRIRDEKRLVLGGFHQQTKSFFGPPQFRFGPLALLDLGDEFLIGSLGCAKKLV